MPSSVVLSPISRLSSGFLLAGILWVAPLSHAQNVATPPKKSEMVFAAPIPLKVGQSLAFPLSSSETFSVEGSEVSIQTQTREQTLRVKAVSVGEARLRIKQNGRPDRVIAVSIVGVAAKPLTQIAQAPTLSAPTLSQTFMRSVANPQLLPPENGTNGTGNSQLPSYLETLPAPTIPVPGLVTPTPSPTPAVVTPAASPTPVASPAPVASPTPAQVTSPVAPALPTLEPLPTAAPASSVAPVTPDPLTVLEPAPGSPVPAATPIVELPAVPLPTSTPRPTSQPIRQPVSTGSTRISQPLPAPAPGRSPRPSNVRYQTTPRLPSGVTGNSARQTVQVSQGLARLISFPDNILSVFFSDPSVMDARAINARTIAVTGVGGGQSTLAVFTSRFPNDAIGKANIYRIQTNAKTGGKVGGYINLSDPKVVQSAINQALGDPRIRVFATKLPDGTSAVRLTGVVKNQAEVEAARAVAALYSPNVVSSLYADPTVPSIDAVLTGAVNLAPEAGLQENLRRITGNSTIELVPLPTGVAFKAEVDSESEAESLLRVLPTLNQQVIPFIVVRGQSAASNEKYYNSTVPLLQGEDLQLTQRLQSVTGIRTVYAVRASGTSVAIYGNVRTRADYEAVRRFSFVVAQSSTPAPIPGTTQGGSSIRPFGTEPALPSYDPVGGYQKQLAVQLYVRITDPAESTIRNVAVETSIVEVSRNALRNLGVEYGSATLLSETAEVTAGGIIINREIDPSFRQGTISAGNGFAGGGSTQFLDPIRAQFNALAQRGDARILSRPTIRAVEGASAQITIGGERPVPSAGGGANSGLITQQVEFRRFGVIISMRPTITDDNTIILQIRADVTQPDRTFEINLNGALIPGESVRSIDTTLTIRPGDTVVMGGLMTNDKRQRTSKVPILGDLPILGSLFQSKRFENNETELAIFMTPRIEAIQATREGMEMARSVPGFPALPSRQESDQILGANRVRE